MNADGSIQGVDSDSTGSAYEPHYQQITSAEQVQVYEPIMGDSDGSQTYTLLQAAAYLKDNQVPRKGFTSQMFQVRLRSRDWRWTTRTSTTAAI